MGPINEQWILTIGLEIHIQINTKRKLFSYSHASFGEKQNENVSLFDAAMPGSMPILNEEAIEKAIKSGLAFNCDINSNTFFERKHYFYPDLPSGFQITQLREPICIGGHIYIKDENENSKKIRINRIQLEQDAGKSIHDINPDATFIDLNRAGVPLLELVTEPDISTADEAIQFLKKVRSIVRYINCSSANMEKGEMRCDANVSLRPKSQEALGTRVEIKNLNSFQSICRAIEYECNLQKQTLENGGRIEQQTKLYDVQKMTTKTLRTKTDELNYKYMRDPDLRPVKITSEKVEKIKSSLPELPDEKEQRYINDLSINPNVSAAIIAEKSYSDYFEYMLSLPEAKGCSPEFIANWISRELFGKINKGEITLDEANPKKLIQLIRMVEKKQLSAKNAIDVFNEMFKTKEEPMQIMQRMGLAQINDEALIREIAKKMIESNLDKVAQYKAGKDKVFQFFVGQIMAQTKGKANPAMVKEALEEEIKNTNDE